MQEIKIYNYKFVLDETLMPIYDKENEALTIGHTLLGEFVVILITYFERKNNEVYLDFRHFNKPYSKYAIVIKDSVVKVTSIYISPDIKE